MIFHVLLVSLGHYSVLTFFADRASSFGIARENCTLLLSVMGFASTISRIGFGILVDKYRSQLFLMISAVLFVNGCIICISSFMPGLFSQIFTSIVFGCCLGAYVTSLLVLVSCIVDDSTVPMSLCVATIGVATLIGPSSVGLLRDFYGTFLPGFLTSGMSIIIGSFCLLFVQWSIPNKLL